MGRRKNKKRNRRRKSPANATLYFGYGSNMHAGQMGVRCPKSVYAGNAALYGWEVVERLYADIDRSPEGVVYGTLWYVPDEDLRTLDRYEGTPTFYERVYVSVVSERGTETALVYVMTPKMKRERGPREYSYDYALTCYTGAAEFGVPVHATFRKRIAKGDDLRVPVRVGPTIVQPWPEVEDEKEETDEFEEIVEEWQRYGIDEPEDEFETDEDMLYDPGADVWVPADQWLSAS